MPTTRVILIFSILCLTVTFGMAVAQSIPEEARRHMARGQTVVEIAKSPDEYGPAIKEFQAASRLAPGWPDPWYNLALLLEKTGKPKEAVASLKEYLRLAPNAPDAAKIREHIYKLEYKAEQVLTVPEVVDVLVSFSDSKKWQRYDGESIDWCFDIIRGGNDSVKAMNFHLYSRGYLSYKTFNVTGPTLKYVSTINVCDAHGNREFAGGCDSVVETIIEVVSSTSVEVNQRVVRAGSFYGVYRDGDKRSCKYRKK